jgi:hypothetical protein
MFHFNGKDYKYRTFFEAQAKTIPAHPKEKQQMAIASLNSLTGIFDEDIKDKIRQNPDLLYVATNLILANHKNLNGDCILLEDLFPVAKKFEYKQTNVEHDRSNLIGFIDEVGWSSYPSNELINEDDVLSHENPVQLVIGNVLWKIVNPELCNLIEQASNENSPNYGAVSESFELLFDDYWVAVGPIDAKKSRLIKPGEDDFEKYDNLLPQNGGSGRSGADYVYRVLKGDILPIGAGVVRKPASGLKGIAVVTQESQLKKEDEAETEHPLSEYLDANNKNINKEEFSVTQNKSQTNNIMVISKIEDIESQFEAFAKLPAKEATASIQKIMEDKLIEVSKEFEAKVKAEADAKQAALSAQAELETRAADLGKAVNELQAKLDKIEQAQAAATAELKFNERMASLDEVFDLDDEARSLLVEEVKSADSDEAFAVWMDKKKKLMKEKTKSYKSEKAECMKKKLTDAGVKFELDEKTLDIKEVIASAKEISETKVPNSSPLNDDLKVRFSKALKDGVVVAGVKSE